MNEPKDIGDMPKESVVSVPLTFGSLFAGIGGIDLGFERAGMVCKWQVEIDPYAQRVLAKHWPGVRRWDDVRTWPQPDTERVDVIAGGFPCQDISYAGLGAGLDGERSGLFFEAIRVVQQLQPRFVVLENVAALLTRGLDRVLGTLATIGFDAEWHCIPAAAVGAPHIRDRVFVLGHTNRCRGKSRKQTRESARHRLSISAASDDASSMANSSSTRWQARRDHGNANGHPESSERPSEFGGISIIANAHSSRLEDWPQANARARGKAADTQRSRLPIERSSWWESEPDVGRVANGISSRVDRLRGLGNAVVPQVAEWIGKRLIEAANSAH